MSEEHFNPDDLPTSQVSKKLLDEIYEQTGTDENSCKGLIAFYVNSQGQPEIFCKSENFSIECALVKTMQIFSDGFDDELRTMMSEGVDE